MCFTCEHYSTLVVVVQTKTIPLVSEDFISGTPQLFRKFNNNASFSKTLCLIFAFLWAFSIS